MPHACADQAPRLRPQCRRSREAHRRALEDSLAPWVYVPALSASRDARFDGEKRRLPCPYCLGRWPVCFPSSTSKKRTTSTVSDPVDSAERAWERRPAGLLNIAVCSP
jgi:hypothetical protein